MKDDSDDRFNFYDPREDGVVIVHAADLKPEPVCWLWTGWLALGKLHIIAGAPGQGKTTIVLAMGAIVTKGGYWPDGSRCEAGSVLIWSGEDDPADTLLPRLIAMGADVKKVHFVGGTRVNGQNVPFDPARDLVQLTAAADRIGDVKLLMVDPIVSAVAGDSHKSTEVRRALQPLVDLGQAIQAAVVGVTHFAKGTAGQDPTERVVGSVAFGAVARLVMVAAKVKTDQDETKRLLARAKSNIGPDEGGFEYSIEQIELGEYPGVHASRIVWGDSVQGTARELLAEAEQDVDSDEASALDDAVEFIKAELAEGEKPAKEVYKVAGDTGHARRTLERAKRQMRVISRKTPMGWYWSLPNIAKNAKDAKIAKVASDDLAGEVDPATNIVTNLATLEHGDVDDLGEVGEVAPVTTNTVTNIVTGNVGDLDDVGDLGEVAPAKTKPVKKAKSAKKAKAAKVSSDALAGAVGPEGIGDPDHPDFIGPPDLRRKAREMVRRVATFKGYEEGDVWFDEWMDEANANPVAVLDVLGHA